jgi:hypothetical protein
MKLHTTSTHRFHAWKSDEQFVHKIMMAIAEKIRVDILDFHDEQ